MNEVVVFDNVEVTIFDNAEFGELRAWVDETGTPWFIAKGVCNALGLSNVGQALAALDEDEKSSIIISDGTPGNPNKAIVSEPGFYKLVMRSRKPEAKAFQRWVTHEVLPELRRYGAVVLAADDEDDDVLMARAILAADRKMKRQDARIAELEGENAQLRNKARAFDTWVDEVDGLVSVTKAAKLLRALDKSVTARGLRGWLREKGYVEKKTLSCTVKAIEPGYMRERLCKLTGEDGRERFKSYGCLTAKGVAMCAARYCGQASLALS